MPMSCSLLGAQTVKSVGDRVVQSARVIRTFIDSPLRRQVKPVNGSTKVLGFILTLHERRLKGNEIRKGTGHDPPRACSRTATAFWATSSARRVSSSIDGGHRNR